MMVDVALIDNAGVKIAYRSVGPSTGQRGTDVLLTHGYAASSHMFAGNADVIAQRHRVITWDVRGHGSSDAPADVSSYSVDLAVADMLAILDHLEVERAVVCGHSMGGFLSLRFHLAHPDRVRGLVLIDTGPGYRKPDGREVWNRMAAGFGAALDERGFAGHAGGPEFDPSVHRHGPGALAMAARGILTQHDSSVIESLPNIAVPTLVIVGADDAPFVGGSQYMASKIPGAQLVVIEGAGHAPNVSHPLEFDTAVTTFLDRLGGRDE
jgi:pimeloyl-ACP methyl ester carboxylesterase